MGKNENYMKKLIIIAVMFVSIISIHGNIAHAQSGCGSAPGGDYGPVWWNNYQLWCKCVGGTPNPVNQSCTPGGGGGNDYWNGAPQFFVFLFIFIFIFAIAFSAQKRKAALAKINLPNAEPPIMNNPVAPAPAPAAIGPTPKPQAKPQSTPAPDPKAKRWGRIFRPVYGKKIWQKPKSQNTDKKLEKF